jgi:hypothetical protein
LPSFIFFAASNWSKVSKVVVVKDAPPPINPPIIKLSFALKIMEEIFLETRDQS